MTKRHAFIHRIPIRGLVAVVALGCFQIAHAASEVGPYGSNSVEYKQLSKVGVWKPLTGSTPGGTGVIFQQSGATDVSPKVSDLRIGQSGKGVNVSGKVDVPIGATGKTVPVLAKAAVTGAMYARGVGAILGGPLGLTLLAFPLLSDLINSTPKFRTTPEGGIEKLGESIYTGYEFKCGAPGDPQWFSSINAAAGCWATYATSSQTQFTYSIVGCSQFSCTARLTNRHAPYNSYTEAHTPLKRQATITGTQWMPASMDDIVPYMDTPEAPMLPPAVVGEGAKNGVDPFSPTGPEVTVSGPSSVPGSTSSTTSQTRVNDGTTTEAAPGASTGTQPATKTTTTSTTNNVTYNQNKVTTNTTTTTTTNITNNVTNQTETKTDQETVKEEPVDEPKDKEPEPDLCEKNPDILACSKPELDKPDVEIPKSEKTLTYTEEDSFGGGNCPADLFANINGQSIKVYDWAQTCGYVNYYLRPLILLLGAMGALFILIPGRDS